MDSSSSDNLFKPVLPSKPVKTKAATLRRKIEPEVEIHVDETTSDGPYDTAIYLGGGAILKTWLTIASIVANTRAPVSKRYMPRTSVTLIAWAVV